MMFEIAFSKFMLAFKKTSVRFLLILTSFLSLCVAFAATNTEYNLCASQVNGDQTGPIDNVFLLNSGKALADVGTQTSNEHWFLYDPHQNLTKEAGITRPSFLVRFDNLSNGGALIDGDYGLLKFDSVSNHVAVANGSSKLGNYHTIFPLVDGNYLIDDEPNFYLLDVIKNNIHRLRKPNELYNILNFPLENVTLANKELLLITIEGLTVFNQASDSMTMFGPANLGMIKDAIKLQRNRFLIATSLAGWFVLDPISMTVKSAGPANYGKNSFWFDCHPCRSHSFINGDVLLGDDEGLSLFDFGTQQVKSVINSAEIDNQFGVAAENQEGKSIYINDKAFILDRVNNSLLPFGDQSFSFVFDAFGIAKSRFFLDSDAKGLFIIDGSNGKILQSVPLAGIKIVQKLADGGLLIISGTGNWWRVDTLTGSLVSAGQTGSFGNYDQASIDGGVLVMSPEGEYFYDPATKLVHPAGSVSVGHIYVRRVLPNGGLLIGAANGLFFFDPMSKQMMNASSSLPINSATSKVDLPNNSFLFGTNIGLIRIWLETAEQPCPAPVSSSFWPKIQSWW